MTFSDDLKCTAPLTQAAQTLESSRDAGFDLATASGEVVDNSIESGATSVRIATINGQDGRSVAEMAFGDNGSGIDTRILPNVLSMGYSSRYNSRKGLGRFGMGLKLASLSQARRIEVYTKTRKSQQVYCTTLDLDLVFAKRQTELSVAEVGAFPSEFANLMQSHKTGAPFESGTLVVWRKIDRLVDGGRYGTSVQERLQDLTKFLARAYRHFIDKGLYFELDEREITLHDPLFLLSNPRVIGKFKEDLRSKIVASEDIIIDGHRVNVKVSLLPEAFRHHIGKGGLPERSGEQFKDLYIPDNEGKISILRQHREIYYDLVPKLYPGGKDKPDRFIGVEVSFPAALDEYFQVRNVKRGAEPVSKLRAELRKFLEQPIKLARKHIREHWHQVANKEVASSGDAHSHAHEAVENADQTSPPGQANLDATPEDVAGSIKSILQELNLDADSPDGRKVANDLTKALERRSVTLVDGSWPGRELIEIEHLNGRALVRLNHRHPFMSQIYARVKSLARQDPEEITLDEMRELMRKVDIGLDVLLMAYAKAESMQRDPSVYDDLRTDWGKYTSIFVGEALSDE